MKQTHVSRFLFVFLTVILAIGCQSRFELETPFDFSGLSSDAFAVPDYYDFEASIQEASIDKDMTLKPVFRSKGQFARMHGRYRGGRGGHIGAVLRELNITEEQGAAIKTLVVGYREQVKAEFDSLHSLNQAIIDSAKAERKAILQALHNGEITHEQAKAQLRSLSEQKRHAILNDPESIKHIEAICAAKKQLFADIRAVFDATQQAGWDTWVGSLQGYCFGGGN